MINKKPATEEVINEMILNYLDGTTSTEFYKKYSFTKEQMLTLGNAFSMNCFLMNKLTSDEIPPLEVLDKYLESNDHVPIFDSYIVRMYNFNDYNSLVKYGKYMSFKDITSLYEGKLTKNQIGQIIKPPKVGYTIKHGINKYTIVEVGKDNLYIIAEDKETKKDKNLR